MMQYTHLNGLNKPISRLLQGTAMLNFNDLEQSLTLLDQIFALGCTTFDIAHIYNEGDSERIFGQWLAERNRREQVVIISKAAHHNQDRKRVTPFDITADLFDSLARLQTNNIDLYLLHRDDPSVPVGPIIDILNEHQQAGRITLFGASNWSHERIEAANQYAQKNGLQPFALSSPNFSLAEQVKEPWPDCITISGSKGQAAREWYQQSQMPLFTWSSLAGGFFSGRFSPDNLDTFDNYFDKVCITAYCYEENFQRLERVRQLAQEKGLTIAQIALAYVLNQPLNIFAIVGCRNEAEFKANMEAAELTLTPTEIAWLELTTA